MVKVNKRWSTDVLSQSKLQKETESCRYLQVVSRDAGHGIAATMRTHHTLGQAFNGIHARGALISLAATVAQRVLDVNQLLGQLLQVTMVGCTKLNVRSNVKIAWGHFSHPGPLQLT